MPDSIDFVIVTAIELERRAICHALQIGDGDRIYKGARVYWKKQVAINDSQYYEIVVTQLSDAATLDAVLGVSEAIAHWAPKAVLMVGIAGAARDNVQLGDVVIGQAVVYYERGKDTLQGRLPEPRQYPADEMLWAHIIGRSEWQKPIPALRPDGTNARPQIHLGVIASGERVVANADIRDDIAATNRKIHAIEMEGYGLVAAAWKREQPVRCLVIRGISDRADAEKNDLWQPYAATVAAEFTKHFLENQPLPPHYFPPRISGGYALIIDDLRNGSLVPFLGPGINASFYIDLALKLADFVQDTLLSGGDQNSNNERLIQALIGIPCSVCHYWPKDRPTECPMLRDIDGPEDIRTCSLYVEQGLAVSKINLRYLAQYYIFKNGPGALYGILYNILDDLEKDHQPGALHHFLATLPRFMKDRRQPRRTPGLPFATIVTTNYDDMLEQAFIAAEQPFDLVYYVADGEDRGNFIHQPYGDKPQLIKDENYPGLPLPKSQSDPAQIRPVILKLFGTWKGDRGYFVATEEHLAQLVSTLRERLPTALMKVLKNNNILFLGYSPSDSDLQHLTSYFWPDNQNLSKSWLVHQAKPGRLEQETWKKRNVELIDIASTMEDFLTEFQSAMEARIRSYSGE